MTCQTLLGLEDASKSKPQLVSPMFKGMEGRSMNVIEIIKNGYNPTDCPERILSYQPSWSFGVLIAFSNSVLCLSTQMRVCHMRTLIGHWLQGNLHAEHFLLVTRPTVSLFFCSSERNWKAGPCAGASNDKFSMKCRRLPDSSSYKSRSYVWEGTAWKTRVAG